MKIKTAALFCILLITTVTTFAQNFEGKITYQSSYKSKIPNVSDQQFTMMMGNTQQYFIKDGNYKSTWNGTMIQWQLYLNADNKLYTKMSTTPSVYWNDGASNPDEVIKAEINKNAVEILGYPCDELILTCKSGVQKFYFNSKIKVDPKLFEKHKFGNWSEVMSRTNAVPLKMIVDNPQFTLETAATEVKPMKLDEKEFQLPANAVLEKSPY